MNYNHFGEVLKYIRISNNMTLEQLSDGICSVRQLSRIESGNNNPSVYVLHNLSKKLNIDLQEYYRVYFTSKSFLAYNIKSELSLLISKSNLDELKELLTKIEPMDEFQDGENRQYVLYGKAMCSTYFSKDYSQSNDYCFEGLSIEDSNFNIDLIQDKLYSNVGLTMINLIASNYNSLGEKEKSFSIIESLFKILDNFIFNTTFNMYQSLDFEKKLYQSTSYNLSVLYMNKLHFDKSMEYVEKGIRLSKDKNYVRFLPELLAQKSRLLFKMGLSDESYKLFNDCLSFYRIFREEKDIVKLEKEIQDKFSQL